MTKTGEERGKDRRKVRNESTEKSQELLKKNIKRRKTFHTRREVQVPRMRAVRRTSQERETGRGHLTTTTMYLSFCKREEMGQWNRLCDSTEGRGQYSTGTEKGTAEGRGQRMPRKGGWRSLNYAVGSPKGMF